MQAKLGPWKLWLCKGESGWQGEGLRGGWLLPPQASHRLKGVGDLSLPESAVSQAWHFEGPSPSSQ